MGYIKCPRCELNYMLDTERYCSVCKREMRGEDEHEELELCSACGEHPVVPGEELHGVDFSVRKGEILGIGGLAGHGKAAIANGIMGLYPSAGEVLLYGKSLNVKDTLSTLEQGVMFVSEDRRGVGLLLDESVETNITVAAMRVRNDFTRKAGPFRFYDRKKGKSSRNFPAA